MLGRVWNSIVSRSTQSDLSSNVHGSRMFRRRRNHISPPMPAMSTHNQGQNQAEVQIQSRRRSSDQQQIYLNVQDQHTSPEEVLNYFKWLKLGQLVKDMENVDISTTNIESFYKNILEIYRNSNATIRILQAVIKLDICRRENKDKQPFWVQVRSTRIPIGHDPAEFRTIKKLVAEVVANKRNGSRTAYTLRLMGYHQNSDLIQQLLKSDSEWKLRDNTALEPTDTPEILFELRHPSEAKAATFYWSTNYPDSPPINEGPPDYPEEAPHYFASILNPCPIYIETEPI